jgi:endonuclease/exonuclease/phosphatase (EEP) superfamily protein YafD
LRFVGTVKDIILAHDFNIRSVLLSTVKECELANERIYVLSVADQDLKSGHKQSSTSLTLSSLSNMSLTGVDQVSAYSNLNSFDSRFIPPKGPLREEWAKYVQLGLCSRWALDHVFIDGKKVKKKTNLKRTHTESNT